MAIRLKVQTNQTIKLKTNGSDASSFTVREGVPIYPASYSGSTEVTPTEEEQILPTGGLMVFSDVTVHAIPSDYVGSAVEHRDEDDLQANADKVSVPAGYYEDPAEKSVGVGSATTPSLGIEVTPSISVSTSGLITATANKSESITPAVVPGYVGSGTAGTVTFSGSNTSQLSTQGASTITPTESEQTAVTGGKYVTGAIKVGAIPSNYVGSSITRRSGSDLSASGATVSVPAGFYEESASKAVQNGTAGTPTASKSAVSNHAITVTPSVTNSAGYISGGTKTGTGVSVAASELVSGTRSITQNGTGIDVTEYAAVDVSVSGGSPNLQTKTKSYTPTTSEQTDTITPDAGYDGLEEVDVTINAVPTMTLPHSLSNTSSGTQENSFSRSAQDLYLNIPTGYNATAKYYTLKGVPNGSVTMPSAIVGVDATVSVPSSNKLQLSGRYSASPVLTSQGYIGSVSPSSVDISITADVNTRSSTDLTASGATVTAPAGYYADNATKTIASGTEGTPTATKGTVSNHAITVTPSVTNSAGYINGSTKTGTAVTVSASELVSGSETKTANGTYDVTNLAELIVNVSGSGLVCETGLYNPTTNIARPTISFSNTHTNMPIFVLMVDGTGTFDSTTNSNYAFMYCDFSAIAGADIYVSSSTKRYGFVYYLYRGSSSSSLTSSTSNFSEPPTSTQDASSAYPRYWVKPTGFQPYSNSNSRYWRSNRAYKWIAIWK